MQWTADGDGFFASRCKAAGGGKKRATDVAGRRARRSRSSVRPNPFEDAVGVAGKEIGRNTALAPVGLRAKHEKRRRTSGRGNLTPDVDGKAIPSSTGGYGRFAIFAVFAPPTLAGRRRSPPGVVQPSLSSRTIRGSTLSTPLTRLTRTTPTSWFRRGRSTAKRPVSHSSKRGIHVNGQTPLFFALAMEAEWRKRANGVVPAQPTARPEGQRPTLKS